MHRFDSAGRISSLSFLRPMFSFCSVRITERSLETNVNTEGERWLEYSVYAQSLSPSSFNLSSVFVFLLSASSSLSPRFSFIQKR